MKSTDGSTTHVGQVMFSLGGRDAIAEPGALPFFRASAPGDQGEDVLELKQILAASGDDPGTMDNYFSQQTQFALAQWQAQHHYPNSTPANPESVTVSLEQGTGYKVGTQSSARTDHRTAGRTDDVVRLDGSDSGHPRVVPYRDSPHRARDHDPVGGQPGAPGRAGVLRDHRRFRADRAR